MFREVFILFLIIATVASENVTVDWSRVQPITKYPEFWQGKVLQPVRRAFERRQNQAINQFVTGGNPADRFAFPFKAALISEMSYGQTLCGGSLISRWSVLTSAHCIYGSASTIVILGANDLTDPNEPFQVRFRVQATNYKIHPDFVEETFSNDIAIVRFHYAIHSFTGPVNIVNLPSGDELLEMFPNNNVLTMGFGRYSDESENNSYQLLFVETLTMASLGCRLRYFQIVDNSHICSRGWFGRNLCSGDEGSPLVIERTPGHYIQIGVASFHSPDGCEIGIPSVHSRITFFIDWILENM